MKHTWILAFLLLMGCEQSIMRIVNRYEIKAFAMTSSMEGSFDSAFFVAAGNMGQVTEYVVLRSMDDGGIMRVALPANVTIIYETNERKPQVEVWDDYVTTEYHIYVPEGSIWYGYEMDIREGEEECVLP